MKNISAANNLYWMLLQVSMRAKHGLIRLADAHDLTMMQLYTLSLVKPNEPLPMNSISSMLLCDASNVTGIIDRLLARGYITRDEKPEDRRVKMIALTHEGAELQKRVVIEMAEFELPGFERLDDEQRESLRALLTVILDSPSR